MNANTLGLRLFSVILSLAAVGFCVESSASPLLEPFLSPYKMCANDMNITYPYIGDNQTLASDIAWILMNYTGILECIDDDIHTWRQSTIPEQWYFGYMFNKSYAAGLEKSIMNIIQVANFDCLADDLGTAEFITCIKTTRTKMKSAYTTRASGYKPDITVKEICQLIPDPAKCVRDNLKNTCEEHVIVVLEALLETVSGSKCAVIAQEERDRKQSEPDARLVNSALYICANKSTVDISILLPMPYSRVSPSINITVTSLEYKSHVDYMCSQAGSFTNCVKYFSPISNTSSLADNFFNTLFDLPHLDLDRTIKIFCSKKQILKDNFACHFDTVVSKASTCWRGITQLLDNYEQLTQMSIPLSVIKDQLMSDFLQAAECRGKELAVCDTTFSSILEQGYKSLVTKDAMDPEMFMFPFLGFRVPIIEQCAHKSFPRQFNMVDSWNLTKVVLGELSDMCNHRSPFKPCLADKFEASPDLSERLLFEKLQLDGIESSMDMVCREKNKFLNGVSCLSKYSNSSQALKCWTSMTEVMELLARVKDGTHIIKPTSDQLCVGLSKVWKCYAEIVSMTCDALAGQMLNAITESTLSPACTTANTDAYDDDTNNKDRDYNENVDHFATLAAHLFDGCVSGTSGLNMTTRFTNIPPTGILPIAEVSTLTDVLLHTLALSNDEIKRVLECWDGINSKIDQLGNENYLVFMEMFDVTRTTDEDIRQLSQSLAPLNTCIFNVGDRLAAENQLCPNVSFVELKQIIPMSGSKDDKRTAVCSYLHTLFTCIQKQIVTCGSPAIETKFIHIVSQVITCPWKLSNSMTTPQSDNVTSRAEENTGSKNSSNSLQNATWIGIALFVAMLSAILSTNIGQG